MRAVGNQGGGLADGARGRQWRTGTCLLPLVLVLVLLLLLILLLRPPLLSMHLRSLLNLLQWLTPPPTLLLTPAVPCAMLLLVTPLAHETLLLLLLLLPMHASALLCLCLCFSRSVRGRSYVPAGLPPLCAGLLGTWGVGGPHIRDAGAPLHPRPGRGGQCMVRQLR